MGRRRREAAAIKRGDVPPPEVGLVSTCEEEGCAKAGMECFLPDDEQCPSFHYCPEHAPKNGFCRYCGTFWGGIESFEFLHPGICDNCQSSFEHDVYDWAYDPDDYANWGMDEPGDDALLMVQRPAEGC